MSVFLVILPLSPVIAAIQEAVDALSIEGVVPPLSFIVSRLNSPDLKIIITPYPICHYFIIYKQLSLARSLSIAPLPHVLLPVRIDLLAKPILFPSLPAALVKVAV